MSRVARPLALVVDDEALLGLMAGDLLSEAGFDTLYAAGEAEALHRASMAPIDVAIVELWLNGSLAGKRVIRALREMRPDLPIVVITGFAGEAPQADLRGLGGPIARLEKPFGYAELPDVARAVMDRAARELPALDRRNTRQPIANSASPIALRGQWLPPR
jgi:DNA-binding response OmpR family regulator